MLGKRKGSTPVKGTSERDELKIMNKKALARHWNFLPSYGLSSQYVFFLYTSTIATYAPLQNSWKDDSEMFLTFFFTSISLQDQPRREDVRVEILASFWVPKLAS